MTKNEAREALVATWRFNRVGDFIALREVELIEAVHAHEASRSPSPASSFAYADAPLPRSS